MADILLIGGNLRKDANIAIDRYILEMDEHEDDPEELDRVQRYQDFIRFEFARMNLDAERQ